MPKIPSGKPKLVNRGPAGLLKKQGSHINPDGSWTLVEIKPGKKNAIVPALKGLTVDLASLVPDPLNARMHPERNMESIQQSLSLYGQVKPLVVRRDTKVVLAGNGTLEAARSLGWTKIAAVMVDFGDVEAAGYGMADNRTAELARWDFETVAKLDKFLQEANHPSIGWSIDELEVLRITEWQSVPAGEEEGTKISLSDRFLVPPFSVLDARQGYWQDRKRAWLALGIQSEIGRGEDLLDHNVASESEAGSKGLSTRLKTRIERQKNNGLLGKSEQARSHYKANATPGGSLLEAANQPKNGKTVRGDGKGRRIADARTEGSGGSGDLDEGFKGKKAHPLEGGGTGKNSAWMFEQDGGGYKSLKQQEMEKHGTKDMAFDGGPMPYYSGNEGGEGGSVSQSGTSIFDPVLCELVYSWFCPMKGQVLDPFAGGSVRGIVAAKLGRTYTGMDLREEQVAANEIQGKKIVPKNKPRWIVGDSIEIGKKAKGQYDLVFSCPPYGDLECYSEDPRDLSTMDYDGFISAYASIILQSCKMLKNNRFACFCVGDIRDKQGKYRGFPLDTVLAFREAGLSLYNDAVLVTAVGSLPIRVGRQFAGYRKLGKTHQNVLVFIKGDPKKAVEDCGTVSIWVPDEEEGKE